jgi:hypothetical protein
MDSVARRYKLSLIGLPLRGIYFRLTKSISLKSDGFANSHETDHQPTERQQVTGRAAAL